MPTITLTSPTGSYTYTYNERDGRQTTTYPDGSRASRRVTASEQASVEAMLRGGGWH